METINNKTLIIIRGISGVGKTSFAKLLGYPCFEADQYFYHNGKYKFDPTKLFYAHNYCRANVEDAMINGEPKIIQSNTNTTEKEINPYIELAKKYNYQVFSIIMEKRHNGVNLHGLKQRKA